MLRGKRWIPLLVVLVVLFLQYQRSPSSPTIEEPVSPATSTDSSPPPEKPASGRWIAVDEEHIFEGEINRRGRPVGFHSRPGGRDPEGARVVRVLDSPNAQGVYTARVEIFDPDSEEWLDKRSSFFPDHLDREEVLAVIRGSFGSRTLEEGDRWRGPSGLGFQVEGYLLGDRINTAYPLFR